MVVTGLGIVSCIGNDLASVEAALRSGASGIRAVPEFAELGLASRVAGVPDLTGKTAPDRRLRRFMADAALYAWHAASDAIAAAGLDATLLHSPRTGLVVGSGVGSLHEHTEAVDTLRARGISRVPPYTVPRLMGNTTSANLATALGIRGASYSIASACTTSAHAIGHAGDLIRWGRQDVMIAGGAEEVRWTSALHFDAMGVLSSAHNDASASRPYDVTRDGFVIAGGAGILVLEEREHALRRGADIHAELIGYGASSDGLDMVAPDADGAARAMRLALEDARLRPAAIEYINTHGTSTPVGDVSELAAIRAVFGGDVPALSSTKGLTGHAIAAAAAHEAIYCILMMERGFLAACAHLSLPDPAVAGLPLVRATAERQTGTVMSNSFGFGGTNASLVFSRPPA